MERVSVQELVQYSGGTLLCGEPGQQIEGVFYDSRQAVAGGLFIAIPGERTDGHNYVLQTAHHGAAAAFVSREDFLGREDVEALGMALILVNDTVEALQRAAAAYLERFSIRRVAVTGSTGKTGTKEMIYRILSEKYRTVRNEGNLNSPIGLSVSAFNVDRTTEAAVFEMGMDHLGEIHSMAEIVRPQVALINNIGVTHLEHLGTRSNILRAKMEIADFLQDGDVLILNWDNDLLPLAEHRGGYRIMKVGQNGPDLSWRLLEDRGAEGIRVALECGGERQEVSISIPGAHNASNAAMAAAAGLCCGVSLREAAAGFGKLEQTGRRLRLLERGGITIVDDCYNASPDSMRSALDVLASLQAKRRVAVLADMLELGPEAPEFHRAVGRYAAEKKIDLLISTGPLGRYLAEGAREAGIAAEHFPAREDFDARLPEFLKAGDAVLVKASRGMALDKTVEALEGLTYHE